jgi:4-hydroxyphenylpyruvate dioxygenase-like putative hemolysin
MGKMTAQTDGFAFVEVTTPTLEALEGTFARMGFVRTWRHAFLKISVVAQGGKDMSPASALAL